MFTPEQISLFQRLSKLKVLEENTLKYLSAIKMEKSLAWSRLTHSMGETLRPDVSIFDEKDMRDLEIDLCAFPSEKVINTNDDEVPVRS